MTASDAGAAPVNRVAQEPASASSKHKFKPPPGYKVKIDDWDIVYCRKMPILGSRFPKEICMTEAQLKEHMASNETFKRDKDQVSVVCAAYAGCANP
ncbi:MAG: hypothetical protein ACREV5_15200 [Steroidobacter sp.]